MENWPAAKVERRKTAKLRPASGNARTHSESQIEQIAASIREWGWTQPILVDEKDGIIAGHGRVLAAGKLGVKEVPVVVARDWSDSQKRAYMLADNQLAMNADWDTDLLRVEITGLRDVGFDLGLTGFDDDDFSALDFRLRELPEAPESVQENVERLGQVRNSRKKANEATANERDTEHYIVVVFPDRNARERAIERLGLPIDERYIASETVEIKRRFSAKSVSSDRPTKVAPAKHSGSTG